MKNNYTLYTTRDVAHLLYVSEDTVRELNASGYLGFPKGFKVRGQWRFFANRVDAWIETLPTVEQGKGGAAVLIVQKGKSQNKRDKEARLFEAATGMYEMLQRLASKNKFCSNKEITALLARIDND